MLRRATERSVGGAMVKVVWSVVVEVSVVDEAVDYAED